MSDDIFLTRIRRKTRYCDFEKLKTAAKQEEDLVKIKFISGLRDTEARLRIVAGIKAHADM